ncbi:MAG: hypothetical protein HY278_03665 [candidate division NC10 bacterium]|nr:hypothetical protein [candidate division NC10 bacterium]
MRDIRVLITALAATAILTTGLLLTAPSATAGSFGAGPATDQVIREGQVVEIGDTTITIREWAGKYTYRLSPTGRQSLEYNHIQPGDKVRFNAWAVWEIAYYFRKM